MTESGRRERVLVSDASALVRTVMRRALERAGFAVDEAPNKAAALKQVETNSYDVVITDLGASAFAHFGVLVAAKRRRPDTEVIVLTGTEPHNSDLAMHAAHLGARDFITKKSGAVTAVQVAVNGSVNRIRSGRHHRHWTVEVADIDAPSPLKS
jgi:DNA-binding NtrC family response regulator